MNLKINFYKIITILILVLFTIVVTLSHLMITNKPVYLSQTSFVPDAEYIKHISGTFRPIFAQYFYMLGVLEIAKQQALKTKLLFELFRLTIRLDPKLIHAAFFGGIVTPTKLEDLHEAIKLLKEAEELNPDEWRIPYWIGFCYLELEDYKQAAEYYLKASKFPNALNFLKFSPVHLLANAGELERALKHTEFLMNTVNDEDSKEWIKARQNWIKTMIYLEDMANKYYELFGTYPSSLQDLLNKGLIKEIPVDEFGEGFIVIKPSTPNEKCKVRSKR